MPFGLPRLHVSGAKLREQGYLWHPEPLIDQRAQGLVAKDEEVVRHAQLLI